MKGICGLLQLVFIQKVLRKGVLRRGSIHRSTCSVSEQPVVPVSPVQTLQPVALAAERSHTARWQQQRGEAGAVPGRRRCHVGRRTRHREGAAVRNSWFLRPDPLNSSHPKSPLDTSLIKCFPRVVGPVGKAFRYRQHLRPHPALRPRGCSANLLRRGTRVALDRSAPSLCEAMVTNTSLLCEIVSCECV